MEEPTQDTVGMPTMFWAWMTIIVGGLAFMLVTGLSGR